MSFAGMAVTAVSGNNNQSVIHVYIAKLSLVMGNTYTLKLNVSGKTVKIYSGTSPYQDWYDCYGWLRIVPA